MLENGEAFPNLDTLQMDDRFSEPLVRSYIQGVLAKGTLEEELARVRDLLIRYTKQPDPNREVQRCYVSRTNQLFRALLEAKALPQ